ncbi:MAG TPA: phosphate/phosphite/phosphonate ABC transporter substrate-binding protein [Acidobacteriota bacterium]|nr:phosphate/phosphite/phosphonate ABC transporter substrate-binding protein [Acidobacteriota bacterium]
MLRKMPVLCVLVNLLVLTAGCIAPTPPKPGKEVVRISVQPKYSLLLMSRKYAPLFNYLSEETGYDLRVVSARSYDHYLKILEGNQVHIGIQNPLAYITLVKTRGAYPLAKMVQPDGRASYRGAIITRHGSGIQKVADLKNRTVAAASRRSVGGHLAQMLLCMKHGVDVNRDLRLAIMDTQDAVMHAVYQGKADAGFVREDALALAMDRIDPGKLAVIAYTDYYPAWSVAAFANTPSEVAQNIAGALLNLDRDDPEHRKVLDAMGIAGFMEAADSDYDAFRKTVVDLNLPH